MSTEREALAELVALKDLKERIKDGDLSTYGIADASTAQAMAEQYERRKPLAWAAARAALSKPAAAPAGDAPVKAAWIPVAERLPDDDDEVRVWIVGAPGNNGYEAHDSWQMLREDPTGMGGPTLEMGYMWRDNEFEEVTHWQPIAPPGATARAAGGERGHP